jgi:hypothetical protein
MIVIAMTREVGSLGNDVAAGYDRANSCGGVPDRQPDRQRAESREAMNFGWQSIRHSKMSRCQTRLSGHLESLR